MSLKPLSVRELEKKTDDIYEAVVVMTLRSKQVIQERLVDKALNMDSEDDIAVFDPIPEEIDPDDYVEMDKVTTVAVNNFMDGKVKWHFAEKITE